MMVYISMDDNCFPRKKLMLSSKKKIYNEERDVGRKKGRERGM
jgi:hypothetical protein